MFWTRAILWKIIKVLGYLIGMVRYFPARKKNYFFVPYLTRPHVFRHTFCTNYANNGMDIKNLQYLMGHSDAGVTLNVYTHASYAHAAEQMAKISQFRQSPEMKKERDFAVG